jgi:5-methylthioadenosine/S-adenosylhomocysteine deaminase
VIDDGRIVWIGPRTSAPPGDDLDLGDAVVMPGLVNVHTHLELTALRGLVEETDFPQWISSLIRLRRRIVDDGHLFGAACSGIAEGILAGVTCYGDTCESGVALRAMKAMGVRGVMYQEVFGPDPEQCAASMAGLEARIDGHRSDADSRVRVGVSPHAPYSVSDALFTAAMAFARREGLPVAIHIAESQAEDDYVKGGAGTFAERLRARGISVAARGRSPVDMLNRAGALTPATLLIHCVKVDPLDIAVIARRDCAVAHCPVSNAKLGHGVAPIAELAALGVRIGLGSDSMASNNRMDILEEARLGLLVQRARGGQGVGMSAAAALELATLGGARALGLDGEIGSLDVGKSADIAGFSLRGVSAGARIDPEAHALFTLTGRDALFTMVAGRVLARDGHLTSGDEGWRIAADGAHGALR